MSAEIPSLSGSKRDLKNAQLEYHDECVERTAESTEIQAMPLKRFFRSRAHCNPLSHNDGFHYPLSPETAGMLIGVGQLIHPINNESREKIEKLSVPI